MRTHSLLSLLHVASLSFAATCYRNDGTPMKGTGWDADYANNVCNPVATTSHCCSTSDMCLSNGLCMDLGGGNGLEIQGCTDQGWGSPCQNACAGMVSLFSYEASDSTDTLQPPRSPSVSTYSRARLPIFHTRSAAITAKT